MKLARAYAGKMKESTSLSFSRSDGFTEPCGSFAGGVPRTAVGVFGASAIPGRCPQALSANTMAASAANIPKRLIDRIVTHDPPESFYANKTNENE
uniref:Uncharacterized protein n=1 Tax=Cohnella candidum TaxID=2674991 RepID=A0A3G3JZG8_9BACL|nr:hypothetical protein EAV92_14340 [Cohnella candidum]